MVVDSGTDDKVALGRPPRRPRDTGAMTWPPAARRQEARTLGGSWMHGRMILNFGFRVVGSWSLFCDSFRLTSAADASMTTFL